MKIILLKDVEKLGRAGDVKDVSDGYAKNLLIPKELAVIATEKLLNQLEIKKRGVENEKQKELGKLQELAGKLKGLEIKLSLKAGEDGKPFGSITPSKIISGLKKSGLDIEKSQIDLKENIKTLGSHSVKLNLGYGVESNIKVVAEKE